MQVRNSTTRGRAIALHVALMLWLCDPGSAWAGFVTSLSSSVTETTDHLYQYTYTLTGESQSTISAYSFALAVDDNANLQTITGPSDWSPSYSQGATTITWSTGTGLAPGNSAIFSFISGEPPVSSSYQLIGFDPTNFQFYTNPGSTSSPGIASIPEPSSLILAAMGTICMIACGMYRRRISRLSIQAQGSSGRVDLGGCPPRCRVRR